MNYCKKCLMPNTRPGIKFAEDGICMPCHNYHKQFETDWDARKKEFDELCSIYRDSNGKSYDCAIAVSGGKDSHFQVWYIKEVMKMNPVLLSIGNGGDWTETGSKNLQNIADAFSCDIITMNPNPSVTRKMMVKTFREIGSPTWYADALIYAFPYRIAMKLGLKLLFYGENVNYTYGGKYDKETPSARFQPMNDVVKPIWDKWLEDGDLTEKELSSAKQPTLEEYDESGLEAIYLSYYTFWDSHRNYEVAKRFGFRHLGHEYQREGTIEQYNQIDSIGYLLNQYLKYPKFGHASATEMASRWIRAGLKTREEMIRHVEEKDGLLDQGIVEAFLNFTGLNAREFYQILDKWYNKDLFDQDQWNVWKPKFKVGEGLIK